MDEVAFIDDAALVLDAPRLVVSTTRPTRSWPKWVLAAVLMTGVGAAVWFWQRRSSSHELAERREYATALGQHAAPQPDEPPVADAEDPVAAEGATAS